MRKAQPDEDQDDPEQPGRVLRQRPQQTLPERRRERPAPYSRPVTPLLPGSGAAVHDYGLAGYVGGCGRGEEDDDAFEVLGVAEAPEGYVLQHPLLEPLYKAAAHAGREPPRGYGVHGDVMRCPARREVA